LTQRLHVMKKYLLSTGIGLFSHLLASSQQFGSETRDQDFAATVFANTEYRAPLVFRDLEYHPGKSSSGTLLKSYANESSLSRSKGSIVGYSSAGDVQFIGHYKGRRLKGEWKSYYAPGRLCDSGGIRNDVPDGEWKSWYENGQLRFIRTFDAFQFEKAKQEISKRASKIISSPIVNIAREDLRIAYSYLSAAYSFHTIAKKSSGKRLSGKDWISLRERVEHNTLPGNHDYLPPFLECLHHGLYMNFYPDGSVKDSGYYRSGLREGVWEEWINNGKIRSTGFYHRGHKSDTWKYFNRKGELKYLETYDRKGRLLHRKEF
jgi:antitoxin component YwqK of YwqJK toxin-antitoxin module